MNTNIREFVQSKNWAIKLLKTKTKELEILRSAIMMQTPFLPNGVTWQQRVWHIINEVQDIPLCPVCSKPNNFQKSGKYSEFCSIQCVSQSPDTINKRHAALIKKHGSEANYKAHKAEELKRISLEKYGVENVFQASEVKTKIEDSMMEKYGVKSPILNNSVKAKITETIKARYGVEHALQSEAIKQKFNSTMLERHGVAHALQSDHIKEKMYAGNLIKFNRLHHTHIHISDQSLSVLADAGSMLDMHHEKKLTLRAIAEQLSVDKKTVASHMRQHGIKLLNFTNSLPERQICEFLTGGGVEYTCNDRTVIQPLELDIYVPHAKVAIEYCGLFWHSELRKKKNYHANKYDLCAKQGITLVTIFEDEWLQNRSLIENKLGMLLGIKSTNDRHYARNCSVVELSNKQKREFLTSNHLQGNGPSSIDLGLSINDRIVACISFLREGEGQYTLSRYATSGRVVGGFSKLLAHFENLYDAPEISTFADLRYSNGNLYDISGFTRVEVIPADYYWCKDKNRWHKASWRHSNKLSKLPNYDSTKSEKENMYAHGYYRIWDCGKIKYVKNKKEP